VGGVQTIEKRGLAMRYINSTFLVGIGLAALVLGLSLQAQAQTKEEAAASQVFYNIKGGQTVLVDANGELGKMPEAVTTDDMKLLKEQEMWGIQPLVPPEGLVRVEDDPLVGKNINERSGNTVGYTESVLVDPATGLVHYLIGSGGKIGNGRYVPVPVSAVDLESMKMSASSSEVQTLDWYSSSQLDEKYPSQPIDKPIRAASPALMPTAAVAQ
jgi:PRC-barrel domain